jgi:hypothetical protein
VIDRHTSIRAYSNGSGTLQNAVSHADSVKVVLGLDNAANDANVADGDEDGAADALGDAIGESRVSHAVSGRAVAKAGDDTGDGEAEVLVVLVFVM